MKKILLTSVCRPLGEAYGDSPSVGYELLYGQVTRAQGLFSPRANHVHFSLEYVAENLDAPTVVLQYPSKRELVRELRKGYDYVGVSFILATFHRMKEVVALVREHSPSSKIILGGYGTILPDDILRQYGDHVCREEGVAFMRRLLAEPEIPLPYRHPLMVSRLKMWSLEVSRTGMVFAGLGCPNGCDFCCTSHFFKRRHIRLLPTGEDIYRVIERYQEIEPGMSYTILDEDFLLNRQRAMEFRDCVLKRGRPLSIFAFASIKALSQYSVTELLEMGVDGVWIGYEGTRSGYAKQAGRPAAEVIRELREHGITILASMIVGFPYQTPEIIAGELDGLLELKPTYCQFLIYGPTPGTPYYERVMREGLLREDLVKDPERYYHLCTGFNALVRHPSMTPGQIEAAQARCFKEDFRRQGPSVYRSIETWLIGHLKLKDAAEPILRWKSERLGKDIRRAYAAFLPGKVFAPNARARAWISDLERRAHAALGEPNLRERVEGVIMLCMAAWTGLKLKLDIFQHPRLTRHVYRLPEESLPAKIWRRLRSQSPGGLSVDVEQRPEALVWVRLRGKLMSEGAERLAASVRAAMAERRERLVLDFKNVSWMDEAAAARLAERLREYQARIRVIAPSTRQFATLATLFSLYR